MIDKLFRRKKAKKLTEQIGVEANGGKEDGSYKGIEVPEFGRRSSLAPLGP
jgi:hypothetical protein